MANLMILLFLTVSAATDLARAQPSSSVNCKAKLDQCQTDFFNQLKQYKFSDHEMSYYQLCSSDGSYMRFVDCIRQINEHEAGCKQPLHRELCNKRGIKIFSYRYTWKSNLAHDICYRTFPLIDQDFFKHEKCISKVLNTPKWHCDLVHYEKTKKANGLEACEHWKAFRQCIYAKVEEHCGEKVANISDYLFHAHTSYFSKYTACNLPGEPHTKCWLDLIDSIPRIPSMATTTTNNNTATTTTAKPETTTLTIERNHDDLMAIEHDSYDDDERLITNSRTNLIREAKMKNDHDDLISNHQNGQQQHDEQYAETTATAIAGQQKFNENHGQTVHPERSVIIIVVALLTMFRTMDRIFFS
ncbi:hypothetical protein DERF_005078 [Dermatophagoides farinae]|uniref:Uncharacterized protein n=1 Tax=Dermatophagoides farinae TaxID=6954 RepID=A0A922I4K2_DERFA|nr:hypothetical protein HUG17_7665 [Dermatophagoides farinae]KAH9521417.1 hypothetical protein DERF_005078 [Dermatophagoides farinae]